VLAIACRYYSAFIAARIMALDESRVTPAHVRNDGQNYHPTHRVVLFGHHFAAIAGAGPLIGPVLAAQFGYAPGLIWQADRRLGHRAVAPPAARAAHHRHGRLRVHRVGAAGLDAALPAGGDS
jgi:hypothetical protein